jgi:serine/threonine protein kinase
MIGRVIGNYRVVEKVGEGGMGAVYRAVDLMLERDVAIKAIRPELASEADVVERFRAEARMLARVSHTSIATIYAFFAEGNELFLAMEFVRGESLSQRLHQGGPLPWERAVPLFAVALEGIEQAHRAGIVHRDLKPDNLMITETGAVKVMDFGIARLVGSGRLTRTGLVIGTLRYMAPEQIRGQEADRRTDIYALGTVLYEMVTGRVPFDGNSDYLVLKAQIESHPAPPSSLQPGLPTWLDEAILKALAKDPADRFQTVEELRAYLLAQGFAVVAGGGASPTSATMVLSIADQPTLVRVPAAATASGAGGAAAGTSPTYQLPPRPQATPPTPPISPISPKSPISPAPSAPRTEAGSYREIGGRALAPPERRRLVLAASLAAGLAASAVVAVVMWKVAAWAPAPPRLGVAAGAAAAAGPPADPAGTLSTQPQPAAAAGGGANGGAALPASGASGTAGQPGQASPPPYQPPGNGAGAPPPQPPGNSAAEPPPMPGQSAGSGATGGSGAADRRASRNKSAAQRDAAGAGAAPPAPPASPAADAHAPPPSAPADDAGSDGGDEIRSGLAPGAELRQLAAAMDRESDQLRNLFSDFLSRKEKEGGRVTRTDDLLSSGLKDFQNDAERFHSQFGTGFFSRSRIRVGRLSHGETEQAQINRLARAVISSGKRADGLMAEVRPDADVSNLWHRLRQQWKRVAELCGI